MFFDTSSIQLVPKEFFEGRFARPEPQVEEKRPSKNSFRPLALKVLLGHLGESENNGIFLLNDFWPPPLPKIRLWPREHFWPAPPWNSAHSKFRVRPIFLAQKVPYLHSARSGGVFWKSYFFWFSSCGSDRAKLDLNPMWNSEEKDLRITLPGF